MTSTEHTEQVPLPLGEAAARLGLSADALRMRVRRGKARGFRRGGRVYVYLDADLAGEPRVDERARTHRPLESEQPNKAVRAPDRGPDSGGHVAADVGARTGAGRDPHDVVIEFQRIELNRLLKENERLNERLDRARDESRRLADMLGREQVLRQQDNGLRQHLQELIERLSGPLALAPPETSPPETSPPETSTPETSPPGSAPATADSHAEPPAQPEPPATATPDAATPDAAAAETPATDAPERPPGVIVRAAAHAPFAPPRHATPPHATPPHATPPAATQDLAEIVREIGQSLRDIEATQGSGSVSGLHGDPGDDPTDEERRNAARLMKRLMRGRPGRGPVGGKDS